MASERSVEISRQGDVTVVALGPEYASVDESVVEEVAAPILETASNASPPCVLIDLSHTKFFGSSFIEVLFRAYNRLRERENGRFALCGLTPYCREVVEVTHLDRLWEIHKTRREALDALREAGTG